MVLTVQENALPGLDFEGEKLRKFLEGTEGRVLLDTGTLLPRNVREIIASGHEGDVHDHLVGKGI